MVIDFTKMFPPRDEEMRRHKEVHFHEPSSSLETLKDANSLHPEKKQKRKRQKEARKQNRKRG